LTKKNVQIFGPFFSTFLYMSSYSHQLGPPFPTNLLRKCKTHFSLLCLMCEICVPSLECFIFNARQTMGMTIHLHNGIIILTFSFGTILNFSKSPLVLTLCCPCTSYMALLHEENSSLFLGENTIK
jgi:hypothetical protein